ncbi:hypothetical protein QR97_11065 [Streptomyces sp. PBH53]|uniref:hypothetical protein n=1 Tax=Streptomyces sp. PBH53 TaxID=1577075 RepID=UPI000655A535|nr:hypothetical protein [Streptomyces sp. PBH53]AKN70310.1 hypothetical protein QR97_11065 [Streptomyces sp. PBH53]
MSPAIRFRIPRGVLLAVLATGLIAAGGCAALGLKHPETAPYPLPTVDRPSPTAKASARPDGATLSDEQAQAALINETDLGAPWTATRGAATWRDGLLKARTTAGECQRLLDALYSDELLGAPARVAVGLDDADTEAQLRYQIGARRPADVDAVLAWLRTMPVRCARFTATTELGLVENVQVMEAPLPEVGDARQGLRVTVATTTSDDEEYLLTMDLAAVRVGEDSFAFTNAGLGDVPNDATQAAVQIGALRLADIRKQGLAQV